MGGNAINNASRMDRGEYFDLYDKIRYGKYFVTLVKSYRNKETFGDMDLLTYDTYYQNDKGFKREILESAGLQVVQEVKNSNVSSFGVAINNKVFQIDIISLSPDELPFAYHYYGHNDAGNLLGRLARGIGLKLGHDGLWYTQRDDHTVLHEHLLTRDFYEALIYLDMDIERYRLGFDTMEEVFDWVVSSKYYDWNRFDLSQRNYRSRVRDAKRENYRKFLEYAVYKPYTQLAPKESFLSMHFETFHGFYEKYMDVIEKQHENNIIKEKFNGNIVSELTGLTGKELGGLMSKIKNNISRDELLHISPTELEGIILKTYRERVDE